MQPELRGNTAPDGSPVGLYALLPPDGESELIHAALPAGASILELGCGAGRVTRGLVALGHPVVAVDESAAMLALVRGAETVLAAIETLDLGRRFDGVVLGSHLVNTPDALQRSLRLACCGRHVLPDGVVLIERHDPDWAATVTEGAGTHRGLEYAVREVRRDGTLFSAVMEYRLAGQFFRHPFSARILDDAEIAAELDAAGLSLRRVLPGGRRWLEAGLRTG